MLTSAGGTLLLLLLMSTPIELEPCPPTPNCVSTQAEDPDQRMDPIAFHGSAEGARETLLDLLRSLSRVRVVEGDEGAIRAVFTTLVFRFDDDVDFVIDADAGVIHFRSASRVGHSDLGTNRRRMKRLTRLFHEAEARGGANP